MSKGGVNLKIKIYTDGACSDNPGPGGWACVFNTEKKCKVFSGREESTTNNRMELKAVIESFRKITKLRNAKEYGFELYSDSAYVVNSINNGWVEKWQRNNWKTTKEDDVKNKDLWEEFISLRSKAESLGICITIIKIKGHNGNTFNELVDKLAKEESMKAKVETNE